MFAIASLGFGFTRPGFTGGASLAVPLARAGRRRRGHHRRQRHQLGRGAGVGMLLYAVDPHLPFAMSALLLVALAAWAARTLLDA